jgi:asparagine synthase (glutamine-hydrolysing)
MALSPGGDALPRPWAGYDRYKGVKLSKIYSQLPSWFTHLLARSLKRLPGRLERLNRGLVSLAEPDLLTRFTKIYSFFSEAMKQELFKGVGWEQVSREDYRPQEAIRPLYNDVQNLDPVTQMLYIDTRANLPDDLLMVADKTSMANSLEARVPFIDYRLIEFIESLPPGLKLKGLTGKYLHKKAVEKWLPREVVYRKKKGFANPVEEWFRTAMRPYIEDCLLASDSPAGKYFDQRYISLLLERDRTGRQQLRRHIYLLVSFVLWHRTFISS